jgi:hypothetical protein
MRADSDSVDKQPTLDELTRQNLEAFGSNLEAKHQIVNYLYFPQQKAARRAARALEGHHYAVQVGKAADGTEWLLLATIGIIPSIANLAEIRRHLETVAAQYGGDYDGWEAPVTGRLRAE